MTDNTGNLTLQSQDARKERPVVLENGEMISCGREKQSSQKTLYLQSSVFILRNFRTDSNGRPAKHCTENAASDAITLWYRNHS